MKRDLAIVSSLKFKKLWTKLTNPLENKIYKISVEVSDFKKTINLIEF
jgi:hypothetical protein